MRDSSDPTFLAEAEEEKREEERKGEDLFRVFPSRGEEDERDRCCRVVSEEMKDRRTDLRRREEMAENMAYGFAAFRVLRHEAGFQHIQSYKIGVLAHMRTRDPKSREVLYTPLHLSLLTCLQLKILFCTPFKF